MSLARGGFDPSGHFAMGGGGGGVPSGGMTEFTGIRTLSHSQEQSICLWVYARTHALTNWLCHRILTLSPSQGISRQPGHLQRLRTFATSLTRRTNELPMLRSPSIAPTALYKPRPKPLAQTKQLAHRIASLRRRCLHGLRAPAPHLHESLQTRWGRIPSTGAEYRR